MIAVDTNILVRVLVRDEPEQVARSENLLLNNLCFVSSSVILEIVWVLARSYRISKTVICDTISSLLENENIIFEDENLVRLANHQFSNGMDFADAMHLYCSQNCDKFVTFDKKFVKSAKSFQTTPQVELL